MNELQIVVTLGIAVLVVGFAVAQLAVGSGFLGFLGFLGSLGLGVLIGWCVAVRPNIAKRSDTRSYVTEPLELKKLRKAAILLNPASEVFCRPEKAQLMKLLLRKATNSCIKAKKVLVIGFSTGYYTLSMAMSLPPDGEVLVCDITDKLYLESRRFFEEAIVAKKVVLKTGPPRNRTVIGCLDDLLAPGKAVEFDLVFIDVNMILEDKRYEYYEYYWRSLALLRQGGLLVLDIVLCNDRGGSPQERAVDETLKKVRDLNIKLHEDTSRADVLMDLTHDGSDGVIIAEKL